MAVPRSRGERPTIPLDLTRCCPEAQADGVPCPTLGRSCEVCERAMAAEDGLPVIRPPGRD
jgi:hypothetical protein